MPIRHRKQREPVSEDELTAPEQATTSDTQKTPLHIQSKLSKLAKQLAIPSTSTFLPTAPRSERNLRSLSKIGDKLLQAPVQLKNAYLRSGEKELNRISDAALEIYLKQQRKQTEKAMRDKLQRDIDNQTLMAQLKAHQDRKAKTTPK